MKKIVAYLAIGVVLMAGIFFVFLRVVSAATLAAGLWSLQISHDLYMSKQRKISGLQTLKASTETIDEAEKGADFEIARYEKLAGGCVLVSLVFFVVGQFVGRGHGRTS